MKKIFFLILLSGCGIHNISPSNTALIELTADKRMAVVVNRERVQMCAEPAPDVVVSNTLDLVAEARIKMQGGQLSAQQTSEIIQLAGRTQTIVFLREALYRLCEQGLNGNIPPQVIANMFERILLASLQLSQAQLISETKHLTSEQADVIKSFEPAQLELPFEKK